MSLSALSILTKSGSNIFIKERRGKKDDEEDDEDEQKKKDDEEDDGVAIDDILAVIGGNAKKELTIDPSKKNIIVVIGEVPSELHEMLKESGVVYSDMGKLDPAKMLKNEYMSKKVMSEAVADSIMNGERYLHVVRLIHPSMLDTVHLINTFESKGALITYMNFSPSFLFDDMQRKFKEKGIIFNPSTSFVEPIHNHFEVVDNAGDDTLKLSKKALINHMKNYKMFYESEKALLDEVDSIAKSETTIYKPKFKYNTVISL